MLATCDPLIWERSRTERLLGFRSRIEIYVPAHKPIHGYYTLPFLMDEALVARVDLKADRQLASCARTAFTLEPGAPPDTMHRLASELDQMAAWLKLDDVRIGEVIGRFD